MAQDNNRKKNITGSYPGVTGAYNSPNKKQPREFTQPDGINPPMRPRYDFEKTGRVPLTSENDITANVERTGEITAAFRKAKADALYRALKEGVTKAHSFQLKLYRQAPADPFGDTLQSGR